MTSDERTAIIVPLSSDIGGALAEHWKERGWQILGTARKPGLSCHLEPVFCDLADSLSIDHACDQLAAMCSKWDVLVLCAGTQEPIASFAVGDFDAWTNSVWVNFLAQARVIHRLLPSRRPDARVVVFGAGKGPGRPLYSAYNVSKTALVQLMQLLQNEFLDTNFVSVAPGWVKTKIHQVTLDAGPRAGNCYYETLRQDKWVPMERVLDLMDWIARASPHLIAGRFISVHEEGPRED